MAGSKVKKPLTEKQNKQTEKATKARALVTYENVGRKYKYENIKDLDDKIHEYFLSCDLATRPSWKNGEIVTVPSPKPYTLSGLAYFLDISYETFLNYEKNEDRTEFLESIKKAKDKVRSYAEESLWKGQPTGVIFNLKNNWGWKDKTEVEQTNTHEFKDNVPEALLPKPKKQ